MQDYEALNEILLVKNDFLAALKSNDVNAAKNKLSELGTLYKKITGKDLTQMFSEKELNIIEKALGEENLFRRKNTSNALDEKEVDFEI